ncbi:MAG: penicillin-binding protein 2 [Cytophagales bacterium]|nr:MAG: penicillin-binding protein 2 [Cytophagales bacterium]
MNEQRRWIILAIFAFVGLVFLLKLFSIQVLSEEYRLAAEANAIKKTIKHPHRGLIYDRNGKLLVANEPIFTIMVIPNQVRLQSTQDTLTICQLFKITLKEFNTKMKKAKETPRIPSVFIKQISQLEFAKIQDRLIDFSGFYAELKTIRTYPSVSLAHVLGYIGEITKGQLDKDTTHSYVPGDYIGISGIEASYEKELRGRLGVKYTLVDAQGNDKGAYNSGISDTLAKAGKDLTLTIDVDLQQYAEKIMSNKRGSIVAIEPNTGEILAMVSSPTYDPNMLIVGKSFIKNYANLSKDDERPLFNRPVMALYPPGSTFKVVQALVGLQEEVLVPETRLLCDWNLVKCHPHGSPANVHESIQYSCNPYYFKVFRRIIYQNKIVKQKINDSVTVMKELPDGDGRIGLNKWNEYMHRFGLGERIGVDLPNDLGGFMPNFAFYNKKHGEGNWQFNNIYSLGIGQGEMSIVPLQMANIAAIIANKGYFYTPHLVKSIGKDGHKRPEYTQKRETGIDKKHFDVVIRAMRDVVYAGTVNPQGILYDLVMCGKTGTVQNPHGEDHSVFIAFAPMDNPKIAIAVYVENGGFGGAVSAPIASLIIEKYIKGEVSRTGIEASMMNATFTRNAARYYWQPRPENFLSRAPRKADKEESKDKEGEEDEQKKESPKNIDAIILEDKNKENILEEDSKK